MPPKASSTSPLEDALKKLDPLSMALLSSIRKLKCSPEDQNLHHPSSQLFPLLNFTLGIFPSLSSMWFGPILHVPT